MMGPVKVRRFLIYILLFVICLTIQDSADWVKAETVSGPGGVLEQTLDNGMRLIIDSNTAGEIVVINLFLKMGPLVEPREKAGISALMQRVLLKGTTSRSSQAINIQTETTGAAIESAYATDYGVVSLKATLDALPKCLPIFLDIIQNPAFFEAEVSKEREMLIQEMGGVEDQPVNIALNNFQNSYYLDHPYGMRTDDLIKSISALNRKDITDWYHRVYVPQNMVVSIAGKVNPKQITDKFKQSLGKLSRGEKFKPNDSAIPVMEKDGLIFRVKPTQSLCILVGFPAPNINSPDRIPMEVLNWILGGGGMNSRLFTELREEKGLAYHVASYYRKRIGPSYIYAYMTSAPQNFVKARDGLITAFQQFCDVRVSEQELQAVKRAMCGRLSVDNETASDRSFNRGLNELLGLGYDFDRNDAALIERVTVEDIQKIARTYFKHHIISVVSPTAIK